MGRRSKISKFPAEIREVCNQLIREGRTTAEITEHLRSLGGEAAEVSESAVYRYRKNAEKGMEVYRVSQQMAEVWGKSLKDAPESDPARLAAQVLGAVAHHTATSMINSGEALPAGELMFLAKALDHLSKAEKTNLDRILKVKKEVATEAASKAAAIAKKGGLSAETVDEIRRSILGIAA